MADHVVHLRSQYAALDFTPLADRIAQPWYRTVADNVRDALFPQEQPPLRLTSKPVRVRSIWGEYDNHRQAGIGSMMVHAAMIGFLIYISIAAPKIVNQVKPTESITYVAPPPDTQVYTPTQVKPAPAKGGGGGGGGDRDKLVAPKGKLPKQAMEQFTPPAMVIRNEHPKLAMEPTVLMPPQVRLATNNNLPNLGDPMSKLPSGPPSNGTGSGGGIGSGSGGGVGSGIGGGVGPGSGGGFGGGVYSPGGGITAPRAIYSPDPDYSEEARKAKFQGTVVLWLIVGPDGHPRDIKVSRSVGMGLDQKAIDAVRTWKFEPSKKDGVPVAVQINVEVNFHLY